MRNIAFFFYLLGFAIPGFASSSEALQVIIIDPGHGGRDPGAVSKDNPNIMEKNINLEIAKELSRLIKEKLPQKKVVLTRDGDFFISLGERAKLTNQFVRKHAIFVSIHTNSHAQQSRPVLGVEVFYHYRSNTTIGNFRKNEYKYRLDDVESGDEKFRRVLQGLVDDKAKEDGKCLATLVGKGIQLASKEPIRRISPSNLYVVSYGIVPSILVEVGFISNKKLKNRNYLHRLSKGILLGILDYIIYEKKS